MLFTPSENNLFALVDCNNFYASCERMFDPSLRNVPVIVLSNNDGCVVARSEEAKEAGVEMGVPLFEIKDLVEKKNIRVFSSNYVLYGDMSSRVMNVLKEFTPNIEIYSIDEAFLSLNGFSHFNIEEYAAHIKQSVYRRVGLPVSVGIGRTKTLAKIANYIAKRVLKTGAFCLLDNVDNYLMQIPVGKIWGIGSKRTEWLNSVGIQTAFDFKNMPDVQVRKKMSVVGLRTAWELRGISCLALEEVTPDKKAIGCSRMFGYQVETLSELEEAMSAYVSRACVKLRRQNLMAGYLHVIIETNRFKGDYYNNSLGMYINPPSAHTSLLSHYGKILLKHIYRQGYKYNRVGVLLTDLVSEKGSQRYFAGDYVGSKQQHLMRILDRYNSSANHGRIQFASEGLGKPWHMRQTRKSKRFTTSWDELLNIK